MIRPSAGAARSTGIEVTAQYAYLCEVRNGDLSGMGLYGSPKEALEAAGLSE